MKRFILIAVECDSDNFLESPFQAAYRAVMLMQHGQAGAACEDVTRGVEALSQAQIGVI